MLNRLLKDTEDSGIIESGVLLFDGVIPKVMWEALADWEPIIYFNRHIALNRMRLFGVKHSIVSKDSNPLGHYSNLLNNLNPTDPWISIGSLNLRGPHIYVLIFPTSKLDNIAAIKSWDFLAALKL